VSVRLDVSIGPVQGFVAQSRRTRDLWGSSYLLAFLSAHAMRGARDAGGQLVQPVVDDDPLFRWACGEREGDAPAIGSIPNHFVVEVDGAPRDVARAAVHAFEEAWQRVCAAVWDRYVAHAQDSGHGTRDIWDRQTAAFWEVVWTASSNGEATHALARRKHWRTDRPADEPGDKCTVMHDLQELSGHVRARDRGKQDGFWERVRQRTGTLDLNDGERLSAITLVKRLFPKIAAKALDWRIEAVHWPSTVSVATLPWVRRVVAEAPERAKAYAEAVQDTAPEGAVSDLASPFRDLDRAEAGDFHRIQGEYLQRGFLEDQRRCPLDEHAAEAERAGLVEALRALQRAKDRDGHELGGPSSFYALLLADGDRLGKLVGEIGGDRVGRALSAFTADVPRIVRDHDGVTIYAGGDDVLAMLPVPSALSCAAALDAAYRDAFTGSPATLSAGIAFAHVRLPLGTAIRHARRLLDDVAKEANGRDSLAAGVFQRGGPHCEWVTTWRRAGDGDAVELLDGLTEQIRAGAAEPGTSSSLLYRVRETLGLLCGWPRWAPGSWGALPDGLDVRAFIRAEVRRSLAARGSADDAHVDELTDGICTLLGPSRSATNGRGEAGVDALLLARFLASEGREGDDS